MHDVPSALDDSHAVVFVILDLLAAFDIIEPYQLGLLSLLNVDFGVNDNGLSLLETYLGARTQTVTIYVVIPDPIPLTCGMHHVSVPEPVLFT